MKLLLVTVYAIAVNVVLGLEPEEKELSAKSQLSSESSNGTILRHHLKDLQEGRINPKWHMKAQGKELWKGQESKTIHKSENLQQSGNYKVNPSERRVGKTKCRRRHGGRCVRRRKSCPSHLPSKISGKRYCSKFHRCCYQEPCPDGFFSVPGGKQQCFKFFPDSGRSWEVSRALCEAENLQLAKPNDPVPLNKLIVDTYGDHGVWLGAKGTGSDDGTGSVMWIRDGTTISDSNSAWWPGEPGQLASDGYCLWMWAAQWAIDNYPTKQYLMKPCQDDYFYALCELV